MNTFRLKRGVLRLEDDRIFISGDQAGYVRLLHVIAALCWMVFFGLQAQKHYKVFLLTRETNQLLFATVTFCLVLFWLYVGFSKGIKVSGQDEIKVKHILKAHKQASSTDEPSLVTLYLQNNRRRILEFTHLDEQHFTNSLAGKGVHVEEEAPAF